MAFINMQPVSKYFGKYECSDGRVTSSALSVEMVSLLPQTMMIRKLRFV